MTESLAMAEAQCQSLSVLRHLLQFLLVAGSRYRFHQDFLLKKVYHS
jgi:hypothetical protein